MAYKLWVGRRLNHIQLSSNHGYISMPLCMLINRHSDLTMEVR